MPAASDALVSRRRTRPACKPWIATSTRAARESSAARVSAPCAGVGAARLGAERVGRQAGVAEVVGEVFNSPDTVPVMALATAKSRLPSWFRSPTATQAGPGADGESVFVWDVPSPFPSSTDTH